MKYEKLLELAKPYLEKNDLGAAHTLRVLNIAKENYSKYGLDDSWKDVVFSLVVLHDIGGSEIKDQYEKGPIMAEKLLKRLGYKNFDINLITTFIAKHHERLPDPHDAFKILFDADQLVRLSKEEFSHYNKRKNYDWRKVIDSIYNEEIKKYAYMVLRGGKNSV